MTSFKESAVEWKSSSFWTVASPKNTLPFDQAVVFIMHTFFQIRALFQSDPSRYFLDQVLSNRASSVPSHLTRAPLGYSAERAPLGGGADSAPCLTPERMVVERRKKRQTKALNKTNLKNTKNFA